MAAIRVALCTTDLEVGGAERSLAELATRLDRSRFEPVVYSIGPAPAEDRRACVEVLEGAGVPVVYLNARCQWAFGPALLRLRRHLSSQRPQIVQSFLFHANVLARLAARLAGVPHVVSGLRVAERGSRWHLWVDWATSRLVDRYVAVSQAVARFAESEGRLPSRKISVIPNGVDLSRFPAEPADLASLGIDPGRWLVTFVGRLDQQKDVTWLLRTAPRFFSGVPRADLLVVGTGPLEGNLREFAGQMGIAKRTYFLGFRPDVPAILAASRILVLPSRWEGMPNVVLEAMATGLPVVASDVEGVRELLGEAAGPQLVRQGDSADLAAKVIRLLQDRDLATELGQANRLRAEQAFSVERMVQGYEELWAALAESTHRRG